MRLPFPTHLNMQYVLIVLVLTLYAQILNGTDPLFAAIACLAMLFSALAFNVAGGLSTLSGTLICFLSLSTYVTLIYTKIFTFEPTNKNFHQPLLTITLTALAHFGLLVSAWLSRRFVSKPPLVQFSPRDTENLSNTAGGMIAMGVLIQVLISNYGLNDQGIVTKGTIWAALNQLNAFIPLTIILGTYYTIVTSRGARSMNWVVVLAMLYTGGIGFAAASKQGMYTPLFSYFLVCAGMRYRYSAIQVVWIFLWCVFAIVFLFPWAQYARSFTRQPTLGATLMATYNALRDPNTFPAMYRWYRDQQVQGEEVNQVMLCYNHPHGLIDRESLICADDDLIDITVHSSPLGMQPMLSGLASVIPHVLWPNRPSVALGNLYGHETGLVADEDMTTQTAFAPVGDAFREFGWSGVIVIVPVLFFFTFLITDSVFGDVRNTPWGFVMLGSMAFMAPGFLIPVHPWYWGHILPIMLFLVWVTRYVAPEIAVLFGLRKASTRVLPAEGMLRP
jgi:hypothetical protein